MAILSALGAPCEFSHFEAGCFSSRRLPSVIHTESGPAGLDGTAPIDSPSTVVERRVAMPNADDLRNSRRLRGLCIMKNSTRWICLYLANSSHQPSYGAGGLSAVASRIPTTRMKAEWRRSKRVPRKKMSPAFLVSKTPLSATGVANAN